MGILDDVLKALDRIPVWKRLQQLPTEVNELQARVTALEQMLGGKWPAEVCRFCGARAARLSSSLGPDDRGQMHEHWTCGECNRDEKRLKKAT